MKLLKVGKLEPVFKPKQFTTVVAVLIIGAGIASGLFAAITNQSQKREYLIGRAQTIADTVSVNQMKALEGSADDLSTLAYSEVKQQLDQVRNSNLDISYIRIFTISGGQIIINVDAQSPNSEFYGDPGTIVPNVTDALRAALVSGTPSYDAVMSDYSEQWVSGYAPIKDPRTSEVIGAVGAFVPANTYYLDIALYALVPLLLAAIPFAGIIRDMKLQAKEHEILHLKNQFISIASHELRSPLTGMLWGITSLQQNIKKQTRAQQDLLQDMYKSTESSLTTVNEILDSSIFERGQAGKLKHDMFDMTAIISQVSATLNLGAKEKKIAIVQIGDWPQRALVTGDVEALKRAFMNIVSNAIKYGNVDSQVSISYRKSSTSEHVFCIQDSGIGIPHAEQQKVLEGYYRASNATQVQAHGTGLGLWVTRMIIEQHGGRMWLNSIENTGTSVFVALPATQITPVKSTESAASV